MFNVLVWPDPEKCARCGRDTVRHAQFYFGALTAGEYSVGESLDWGGVADQGESGLGHVAALGSNVGCPHCGYDDDRQFRIDIRDDVIVAVKPDDGEIDYLSQGNYYWVVLED